MLGFFMMYICNNLQLFATYVQAINEIDCLLIN